MNDTTGVSVAGSVALVTGANRGIGAAFVQELLAAGAQRVYAAARNPRSLLELAQQDSRIMPVQLDITDEESVRIAVQRLSDVNLLVNNAGVSLNTRVIAADALDGARAEMEVNYFGLLRMSRAFAPVLATNGGGALINVLSILSRVASPIHGSYSASKAAAFSLTQSLRAELRSQGTLVVGVLPAYVETDMTDGIAGPKMQAADVARAALDALHSGQEEVYPGEVAAQVAAWLQQDPQAVERNFAQSVAS
ncbi:MAG: SDR family oxidoreductase [Chloroflexi bacterium]|nr:SDR family oxidoreductase [Chloroflexota bacterium]